MTTTSSSATMMATATTMTTTTTMASTSVLEEEFRSLLSEQEKLMKDTQRIVQPPKHQNKNKQIRQKHQSVPSSPSHPPVPPPSPQYSYSYSFAVRRKPTDPDADIKLDDDYSSIAESISAFYHNEEKKDDHQYNGDDVFDNLEPDDDNANSVDDDELRSFVESVTEMSDIIDGYLKVPPSVINVVTNAIERRNKAKQKQQKKQMKIQKMITTNKTIGLYHSDDMIIPSSSSIMNNDRVIPRPPITTKSTTTNPLTAHLSQLNGLKKSKSVDMEDVSLPSFWQGDASLQMGGAGGGGGGSVVMIPSPSNSTDNADKILSHSSSFMPRGGGDSVAMIVMHNSYDYVDRRIPTYTAKVAGDKTGGGSTMMIPSPPNSFDIMSEKAISPKPAFWKSPTNSNDYAADNHQKSSSFGAQLQQEKGNGSMVMYPSPSNSCDFTIDGLPPTTPRDMASTSSTILERDGRCGSGGGGMIMLSSPCNSFHDAEQPPPLPLPPRNHATHKPQKGKDEQKFTMSPEIWYDATAQAAAAAAAAAAAVPTKAEDSVLSFPSVDPSVISVDDGGDESKSSKVDEEQLTSLFDNDMMLLLSPYRKDDDTAVPETPKAPEAGNEDEDKNKEVASCNEKEVDDEKNDLSLVGLFESDIMASPPAPCTDDFDDKLEVSDHSDNDDLILPSSDEEEEEEENGGTDDDIMPPEADIDGFEEDAVSAINSAVQRAFNDSFKLRPSSATTTSLYDASSQALINETRRGVSQIPTQGGNSLLQAKKLDKAIGYTATIKHQGSMLSASAASADSGVATPQRKNTASSRIRATASEDFQTETDSSICEPLAEDHLRAGMMKLEAEENAVSSVSSRPKQMPEATLISNSEQGDENGASKTTTTKRKTTYVHKPKLGRENSIARQDSPPTIDGGETSDSSGTKVHEKPASFARRLFVMASCLEDTETIETYEAGLALGPSQSFDIMLSDKEGVDDEDEEVPSDPEFEFDYAFSFGDDSLSLGSSKSLGLSNNGPEQCPNVSLDGDAATATSDKDKNDLLDDNGCSDDDDCREDDAPTDEEDAPTDDEHVHTDSECEYDDRCRESQADTSLLNMSRESLAISKKFARLQIPNESMADEDDEDEEEEEDDDNVHNAEDSSFCFSDGNDADAEDSSVDESVITSPRSERHSDYESDNSVVVKGGRKERKKSTYIQEKRKKKNRGRHYATTNSSKNKNRNPLSCEDLLTTDILPHEDTDMAKNFISQFVDSWACCSAPADEQPFLATISTSMDSTASPSQTYSDME